MIQLTSNLTEQSTKAVQNSAIFSTPVDAQKFRVSGDAELSSQTDQIIVGNPTILEELTQLIAAHGTSQKAFKTLTPWDAVKMPVKTQTISGLNLDGDGYPDFLIIRSFEIYVEPQAKSQHKSFSFLIKVSGNADSLESGKPTVDMIKEGAVLAVGSHDGSSFPITDIAIAQKDSGSSQHDRVEYKKFDQATQAYVQRSLANDAVEESYEDQYVRDKALFDAVFAIKGYVTNSVGYFEILNGAEFSKGEAGQTQGTQSITGTTNFLSAPLMRLSERYQALSQNPELAKYYSQQDANILPFMKAISISANKELLLVQEDQFLISELAGQSGKEMTVALGEFKWKGKSMTRGEFYQTLREIEDPAERRELCEAYSAVVLKAHARGLFPMIDKLNALAQKYGYQNYADYIGEVQHGITPAQYDQQARACHDANATELKKFMAELEQINGGQPVNEWDVHHLADKLARQKLGGQDIPKLRFSDALAAAKVFFKDMGIDLDQAPFAGNIIFDTNKREDKYGNAFAVHVGNGSQAWFNTNFDANEEISLEDLGTIVHELTHDIHFIQSSLRSQGNVEMGLSGNPNIWTEGIAMAVDSHVKTKGWMDKYLAHLPQFSDPKVREAVADSSQGLAIYDQMLVMSRARFEINLYQDKNPDGSSRSLEERLNFWPQWAREYLHVEAMPGTKGGRVYATPHFAGMPGYYVSYTGGYQTALKAVAPLSAGLINGDATQLKKAGAGLLHLFKMGARLTSIAEIDAEIDRQRSSITHD